VTVVVMGLGNVLSQDDGLGPFVIQTLLAGWEFDESVQVLDLGTPGLQMSPYLQGQDSLIVVDTVRSDGDPGEIRLYDREQLLKHPPAQRTSPHDPGLKETLLALELHDLSPPHVLVVGVIPAETAYEPRLTDAVRAAVPAAVDAVLEELARLGAPATPLAEPRPPDIWWEKSPAD
jgi:hydrogenase maturation protease